MKTKSKAWAKISSEMESILGRMYDTTYLGLPVTEDSPECVDAILRITNIALNVNGISYFPFTEHYARLLVKDELKSRQEEKKERRH